MSEHICEYCGKVTDIYYINSKDKGFSKPSFCSNKHMKKFYSEYKKGNIIW